MFTYFHDHKNKYNKGQLAPVYILILVIVIIMALVTVNLSKVAMVKTDTANSADAGAIATGAIMANVFNSVAVQNSIMITQYWSSYATIAAMFVVAFIDLTMAYSAASMALSEGTTGAGMAQCATSCGAASIVQSAAVMASSVPALISSVRTAITAIGLTIAASSVIQHFTYLSIRRMALKGRSSSIRNGHGFVFSNSETGSKLIAGSPREEDSITDSLKRNGYRDAYIDFLDAIDNNVSYTYSWKDGRKDAPDRTHSVTSNVYVNNIDEFELRVALLPSLAETMLLTAASLLLSSAFTSMLLAVTGYGTAEVMLSLACHFFMCCNPSPSAAFCCSQCEIAAQTGRTDLIKPLAENAAALSLMTGAFALMVGALAGLLPGNTISSSSESDDLMFFDCWIDDINYDSPDGSLRVRVETTQTHQGADLGLWRTEYPDTSSYAEVDFSGRGSIYPPNPRYGSDIVEVDSN